VRFLLCGRPDAPVGREQVSQIGPVDILFLTPDALSPRPEPKCSLNCVLVS
jgi:hypothetical protein